MISARGGNHVGSIRIDVSRINIGFFLVIFEFRVLVSARLLAFDMCVAGVWKLAFRVSAIACLGIIGTLDNVTLVTLDALLAIAKQSKGTTDVRAR